VLNTIVVSPRHNRSKECKPFLLGQSAENRQLPVWAQLSLLPIVLEKNSLTDPVASGV
jgi:hypothetical protein